MNNLTKQLANLYEPKWNELKQQLDAQDIKVQAPFMVCRRDCGSNTSIIFPKCNSSMMKS